MDGLVEGRIIHIVLPPAYGEACGKHRAGVVTEVVDPDGLIYAHVFLSPADLGLVGEMKYDGAALVHVILTPYSESHAPGSWHFPEQQEAAV